VKIVTIITKTGNQHYFRKRCSLYTLV